MSEFRPERSEIALNLNIFSMAFFAIFSIAALKSGSVLFASCGFKAELFPRGFARLAPFIRAKFTPNFTASLLSLLPYSARSARSCYALSRLFLASCFASRSAGPTVAALNPFFKPHTTRSAFALPRIGSFRPRFESKFIKFR